MWIASDWSKVILANWSLDEPVVSSVYQGMTRAQVCYTTIRTNLALSRTIIVCT